MSNPDCPAVLVKNGWKSYGNHATVLQRLNMTVDQGVIYSIIGASGCGKTTLLSSIVGRRALDQGSVEVFGQRPGTAGSGIPGSVVGYMPQDVSLYPELSIKELIEYFGRLYGMESRDILTQVKTLTTLLDLPDSSMICRNLSGGQQRRTSLAVSLVHQPPLLILDEPTVGVDPLLRESIWKYLEGLVATNRTTVIVTTHYIDEAKYARTVGLMRNGRLLVESSPIELLNKFQTNSLPDAVLSLCKMDSSANNEPVESLLNQKTVNPIDDREVVGLGFKSIDFQDSGYNLEMVESPLSQQRPQYSINKWSHIKALTIKNRIIYSRNIAVIAVTFLMPSINLSLTGLTIGPEPRNLNFGIVNPEVGYNLSHCTSNEGCSWDNLGCQFLQTLPKDIITQIPYSSKEKALMEVEAGRSWGYLEFPDEYSNHTLQRYAFGLYPDEASLRGSVISVQMDKSSYLTSSILLRTIFQSFSKYLRLQMEACGEDPRRAQLPLNFRKPVYGQFDDDAAYSRDVSMGMTLLTLFFVGAAPCILSITSDRKYGTLERTLIAGVSPTSVMSSYMIIYGASSVLQAVLCFCFLKFVCMPDMLGSSWAILVLMILLGLGGVSYGFFISELCQDYVEVIFGFLACFKPSIYISGVFWSVATFPYYMRCLSYSLPYTWVIYSAKAITLKGMDFWEPNVWPGFAIIFAWMILFWSLARFVGSTRS